MRGAAASLLLVAALVACSDDGDPAPASSSTTESTTTTAAPDAADVAVGRDGIVVGGRAVPFGSPRAVVVDALGAPGEDQPIEECPAGPATMLAYEDLSLVLQEDELAGWQVSAGSEVTTADGLGIGSSLAEVEPAFEEVEVLDSTLGRELYADEWFSALLEDDAVVTMWAGIVCAFR